MLWLYLYSAPCSFLEKIFIVGMRERENSQRPLEESRTKKESSRLNMASTLYWAWEKQEQKGEVEWKWWGVWEKIKRWRREKVRENSKVVSRVSSWGGGSLWVGEVYGRSKGRRATLKCVLVLVILRETGGHMRMLIGTTDSHLSFLPVLREMAPLTVGIHLLTFLRNAGFCITPRI